MQAAFVQMGLERDGFLYVSDVVDTLEAFEQIGSSDDDDDDAPPAVAAAADGADAATPCRRADRPRPDRSAAGSAAGAAAVATAERAENPPRAGTPRRRRDPVAEDRGSPPRGTGDRRSGRQGAARHQGRAPHLARHHPRALPRLHAHRRSRGRVPQDRRSRRAQRACAASCEQFREQHGFTGGLIIRTAAAGPPRGRHRRRPAVLPRDLDRTSAAASDTVARARRPVPRAEPRAPSSSATC